MGERVRVCALKGKKTAFGGYAIEQYFLQLELSYSAPADVPNLINSIYFFMRWNEIFFKS